jgi:predicted PurR-regulated permease PerM
MGAVTPHQEEDTAARPAERRLEPAHARAPRSVKTARWTIIVLTVLALGLMAVIVRPFASALFVAAVLAGALHPWYQRFAARLRGRRQLAAVAVTVAVMLVVVIPVASLTVFLAREAADGVAYVRTTLRSEGVSGLVADLPGPLQSTARRVLEQLPRDQEQLQDLTSAQGGRAARAAGGVLTATWTVVVQMALMLIAFFFMLMDGEDLVQWLSDVAPLQKGQTRQLLSDFRKVSVTVLVSSAATAAIQALVALVGYLLARLPHPFFFAVVTFVVGLVPAVGAGAVALVAAGILFLGGHPQAALFLALWAVLAVGLADNVIKPYLMKGAVKLHGAVIFFALIGGVAVFGPIGILAGPLIVSFFLAVVRMWDRALDQGAEVPLPGDRKVSEA